MPEAVELAEGVTAPIVGLIFGIAVILVLNMVVDRFTGSKGDALKIHQTHEEMYHQSSIIHNRSKMLRSGIIMLTALALHNIPEGIAIGAGGSRGYALGAIIALMITLHNIPEGMAVAAPLLAGGVGKAKVVLLVALCGFTTVIGGLIGLLLGNMSDFAVAISLAAAGGAMLYVVFGEIIPQTVVMTKSRAAPLITLAGIIIGLIIVQIR
jgi:ZIP family zinc transporter